MSIKINNYIFNPIISPDKDISWMSMAAFNSTIISDNLGYTALFRAMGQKERIDDKELNLSIIGKVNSDNKFVFNNFEEFIFPEFAWEKYGCEDPRVTKIDNKYYIFYTAISEFPFTPEGVKVAVAITSDFKKIEEKHLVTPFNAKAMALFPEKINGKYMVIFTINPDRNPSNIVTVAVDKIEDLWSLEFWKNWQKDFEKSKLEIRRINTDHVEIGAVPVKTKDGWLLVYAHIRNYFTNERTIFGIEALLLDINNPQKIIGRTLDPILVPQEEYDMKGQVPDVIFPSGAILEGEDLFIYYGAADTHCAVVSCNINELLNDIKDNDGNKCVKLDRFINNPILSRTNNNWEDQLVFNPAAIQIDGIVYMIYRAMNWDNTSLFGLAISEDGENFKRLDYPIYSPRYDFETKLVPGGNSGCEDPRVTRIDDKIYMTYTAYNGVNPPRVVLTEITVEDFVNKNFDQWSKPKLISKPGHDNKDACIFPEKINDKFVVMHRMGGVGIVIDIMDDLEFENNRYLEGEVCIPTDNDSWDSKKIGVNNPPTKTKDGWLVFYHGVSKYDNEYRLGAMLLDLNDPQKVIGRSKYPILEPETNYEKYGIVNNVIFPCGDITRGDKVFVYYGGADTVVGLATGIISELCTYLLNQK